MIKYKYLITFQIFEYDVLGNVTACYPDYIKLEATSFDIVIKEFKKKHKDCEILSVIRL